MLDAIESLRMYRLKKKNAKSSATPASSPQLNQPLYLRSSSYHTNGNKEAADCYNTWIGYEEKKSKEMSVDVPKCLNAYSNLPNRKSCLNPINGRKNQCETSDHQKLDINHMKFEELAKSKKLEFQKLEGSGEFLRDSEKMQACRVTLNGRLDSASGVSNNPLATKECDEENGFIVDHKQSERQSCPDMNDILQAVLRLEASGILEEQVSTSVQSLITRDEFVRAINISHKLHSGSSRFGLNPQMLTANDLTGEVFNDLDQSKSMDEEELATRRALFSHCNKNLEAFWGGHNVIAQRQSASQQEQQLISKTCDGVLLEKIIQYHNPDIKVVSMKKTSDSLGATVCNEDDGAVVVSRIIHGGTAEFTGLKKGDEILEVNEIPVRGRNVDEVSDIFAKMTGTLTLLVIPSRWPLLTSYKVCPGPTMHVKANFNYHPDDDLYIPCRELGLSFMKGDILHIINQADPHWWQAKHEDDDEEIQLPGLIPSANFQQKREIANHLIAPNVLLQNEDEKSEKTMNSLFCAKKKERKKSKSQKLRHAMDQERGTEEKHPYEEVSLYYPRFDRKRPVVLIGPPDIGKHELCQRLLQNSYRFASPIPHTSRAKLPYEIDSRDYHFISRKQFEKYIVDQKFAEHGKFGKDHYGTSLAAIKAVIDERKICILNFHPQSLKILKNSDFMPFVVFVAPPSLQKLRGWRMAHSMEEVNSNELKGVIERAEEMKEAYGHLFDRVIVYSHPDHAYKELLEEIDRVEREPQWVPAAWFVN